MPFSEAKMCCARCSQNIAYRDSAIVGPPTKMIMLKLVVKSSSAPQIAPPAKKQVLKLVIKPSAVPQVAPPAKKQKLKLIVNAPTVPQVASPVKPKLKLVVKSSAARARAAMFNIPSSPKLQEMYSQDQEDGSENSESDEESETSSSRSPSPPCHFVIGPPQVTFASIDYSRPATRPRGESALSPRSRAPTDIQRQHGIMTWCMTNEKRLDAHKTLKRKRDTEDDGEDGNLGEAFMNVDSHGQPWIGAQVDEHGEEKVWRQQVEQETLGFSWAS